MCRMACGCPLDCGRRGSGDGALVIDDPRPMTLARELLGCKCRIYYDRGERSAGLHVYKWVKQVYIAASPLTSTARTSRWVPSFRETLSPSS